MSSLIYLLKGAGIMLVAVLLSGFAVATLLLSVKWALFLIRTCWDSLSNEFTAFNDWVKTKLRD